MSTYEELQIILGVAILIVAILNLTHKKVYGRSIAVLERNKSAILADLARALIRTMRDIRLALCKRVAGGL